MSPPPTMPLLRSVRVYWRADLVHASAFGALVAGMWIWIHGSSPPTGPALLGGLLAAAAFGVQATLGVRGCRTLAPTARAGSRLANFWWGAIAASAGLLTAAWWFLDGRWRAAIPTCDGGRPAQTSPERELRSADAPVWTEGCADVLGPISLEGDATVIAPARAFCPGTSRSGSCHPRPCTPTVPPPFGVPKAGQLAPTVQLFLGPQARARPSPATKGGQLREADPTEPLPRRVPPPPTAEEPTLPRKRKTPWR